MIAIESLISSGAWGNYFITVVDNNSEAKDLLHLAEIREKYPIVHIIYNNENVGYFRGLNVGIRFLRAKYVFLDCIVVGNNDLVFSPNFNNQVVECRHVISEHAVVAPDIVTLDGFHQNPNVISKSSISTFRRFVWTLYYSNYQIALLIKFLSKIFHTHSFQRVEDPKLYRTPRTIHQGYGACYLLGPKFFEYFDELWAPTFLMEEELFLAQQLEDKGLDCYYEPRILVYHHEHATSDNVTSRKIWEISRNAHLVAEAELAKRNKK
jgi:GT2 family glycosyltransferase